MSRPTTPPIQRVLDRIRITDAGCWEYPTLNEAGYGVVGEGPRGGRTFRTHRVTWEHYRGPIPPGAELDHLCRNRACCNPNHLEPVDRSTNVRRGLRKTEQDTCAKGHPFSGDNVRETERQRVCRTCERANGLAYRRRRAGKAAA